MTRNIRGDIEGIYNSSGVLEARYVYDSWGKVLSIKDGNGNEITDQNHIGHINPFRYRGYYYDTETNFYYLQSRYYDPEVGRFINADTTDVLDVQSDLYDKNLYTYCDNNPIVRADYDGMFWDAFFDVASLVVSVIEVIKKPTSKYAWMGLATDLVSLAIPGVTGGGSIVKAISKTYNIGDVAKTRKAVDDKVDSAQSVKRYIEIR